MANNNIETLLEKAMDVQSGRDAIEKAAALLREGKLVIFPTETVYGLGANALNPAAVAGIFMAKMRPADNPLILHVTSVDDIPPLVSHFPESAKKLAEAFWPGPLTLIFKKSEIVPAIISPGLNTVSIRIPSHPVAREIIKLSGVPVAAPSANLSGSPSPTNAAHCKDDMLGRVDMIVDGGSCDVGLESTVLSLACDPPRLLRPGAVTVSQIEKIIGKIEIDSAVTHKMDNDTAPASPGMKYKHYSPKAKVILVHAKSGEFIAFAKKRNEPNISFLAFDEDLPFLDNRAVSYGSVHIPETQSRNLFAALREIDSLGADTVYARISGMENLGLAIYNRLIRAAGFDEIYL